jgi:hypothetical protein
MAGEGRAGLCYRSLEAEHREDGFGRARADFEDVRMGVPVGERADLEEVQA